MQLSLFDGRNSFTITKPLRLITLFSGYDSQALALKYLGVPFEHWKTCEWAIKSIQALKDLHFANDNTDYSKDYSAEYILKKLAEWGISADYNKPMTYEQIKRLGEVKQRQIYNNIIATHNLVNITQVQAEDLAITETDKYDYIVTYSFPCQDLSKAGKQKGMAKGSSTRSGMLWEVERILDGCYKKGQMPQILLMENVPDVVGSKNMRHFAAWLAKLESLGYKCYRKILNSKDFGVPQNRERCFMISLLGDYYYSFPEKEKLTIRLKDLLEEEVAEKYYLSQRALQGKINTSFSTSKLKNVLPDKDGICRTIMARDYKDPKCIQLTEYCSQGNRVYDSQGLSVSLTANGGGLGAKTGLYLEPMICASRGRNPDNPNDRTAGAKTEQRIEVNPSGCSNTLTTVQKDNLVLEPQINLKEQLCDSLIESGKVEKYDVVRHSYSTSRMNKMYIQNNQFHDCSPTLDTRCDCLGVVVPKVIGGVGEKKSNGGTQYYQQDRIYDNNIAISVTTAFNPYYLEPEKLTTKNKRLANMLDKIDVTKTQAIDIYNQSVHNEIHTIKANIDNGTTAISQNLRIRKLTPKECFRLMGVKDQDFERVAKNQSNASLYHLAGDSIVVDVLMKIFKNLF